MSETKVGSITWPWVRWEKDEDNHELIEFEGNIEIGEDPPPGRSGFRIATVWHTPRNDAEAIADLIIDAPRLKEVNEALLKACEALRNGLDILFARIIEAAPRDADPVTYHPSKIGAGIPWAAIVQAKDAIDKAKGGVQ